MRMCACGNPLFWKSIVYISIKDKYEILYKNIYERCNKNKIEKLENLHARTFPKIHFLVKSDSS